MELLKVENLSVEIGGQKDKVKPVRDVSFSLHKGEVLAIVGESGCGKSMLCKSVIGLLPKSGRSQRDRFMPPGRTSHTIRNVRWKS